MQTPQERYTQLLRLSNRTGIHALIRFLENTDLFTAPASHRYHGAYPGGLVDHSLAVYDELIKLARVYLVDENGRETVEPASITLVALLHDLCKVNTYKPVEKFRKTPAGWEKYMGYDIEEDINFGGHGSKSVYLATRYIQLRPEEAVAINCHMSTWEQGKNQAIGAAYSQYPLAWLLHVADEAATFIQKK